MAKKNRKTKYTAAQRKAYWIGYGMTLADGTENGCDSAFWTLKDNSSNEEWSSFQKGLLAPIQKPYNPKLKNNRRKKKNNRSKRNG